MSTGPRPSDEKPLWIGEIRWSDRVKNQFGEQTKSLSTLLKNHPTINAAILTSKTVQSLNGDLEGRQFEIWPSSLYCYIVGRNITVALDQLGSGRNKN